MEAKSTDKACKKAQLFFSLELLNLLLIFRDVAQSGSVPRSGRGGRWFESSHPDISLKTGTNLLISVSLFPFFVCIVSR